MVYGVDGRRSTVDGGGDLRSVARREEGRELNKKQHDHKSHGRTRENGAVELPVTIG